MNGLYAHILTQARMEQTEQMTIYKVEKEKGRPCKVSINCAVWQSPVPTNAGEAESFNQTAERLVQLAAKHLP